MLQFLIENAAEIGGIVALVILAAERVARLTPTNTDNKVLQFVRKIANALGLNFPDRQ